MAVATKSTKSVVHCEQGKTFLDLNGIAITYKYRPWLVKLNPRFVFPALRREHRKAILVNGKRKGYCEMREGLIPMRRYALPGRGTIRFIKTALRLGLGICCSRRERGYAFVKLGRYQYFVIRNVTKEGLLWCEVYELGTEKSIGSFVFNREFTEVYPRPATTGVSLTLQMIIGYIADTLVYTLAASSLIKDIQIIV